MTPSPVEEARAWLAALGPTSAIIGVWALLKHQLQLMHRAQLAALHDSLGRLERAMTNVGTELLVARRRLDDHK